MNNLFCEAALQGHRACLRMHQLRPTDMRRACEVNPGTLSCPWFERKCKRMLVFPHGLDVNWQLVFAHHATM